jgi:dTDP-4-amino-4,6-dideoxygalactose transaminase
MTKVQAAVGLVQLGRLPGFITNRRRIAQERTKMLEGVPEIIPPYEPPDCEHSYYLYTCLVPEDWAGAKRDRLCAIMKDEYGISLCIANPPQYAQTPFLGKMTPGQDLPLSNQLGARLYCPPMHPAMTREQNEYLCATLIASVEKVRKGA